MDYRELYTALAGAVPAGERIAATALGERWALGETERGSRGLEPRGGLAGAGRRQRRLLQL